MPPVTLEVMHEAAGSRARAGVLRTQRGAVETPFLCVVGTAGSVKGVTPGELREMGVHVLLANTYHLYLRPGHDVVRELGGLHRFMAWDGPIVTDSGGYQVFSLGFGLEHGVGKQIGMFPDESPAQPEELRRRGKGQAARLMRVDDEGVSFTSHIDGSPHRLTPELSIVVQEALGADIILAFDEPTSPLHDEAYTARAMERTHAWARRCLAARTRSDQALFGIVQGGAFRELRQASAGFIAGLPFDGVAIGGSLGKSKADMHAVLERSVPRLPEHWPRHMLGIGEPEDLLACVERGIDQFDCVTPTRLARHGHVYTPTGKIDVTRAEYREDPAPIDERCGCYTCRTGFSRGYLRHLFVAGELLAYTLASLHNLHFILTLLREIRQAILAGALNEYRDEFLERYLKSSL
jgi:queuine tRNA-ribosyltransferase